MRRYVPPTQTRAVLLLATAVALVATAGCGGSSGASHRAVTGKITFQGAPVTEGTITFEDAATGFANSINLDASGGYTVSLPDGNYRISIQPPIVQIDGGPETPPDEGYKNVANIPEKFRQPETSGLSAAVSPDHLEHSFELNP